MQNISLTTSYRSPFGYGSSYLPEQFICIKFSFRTRCNHYAVNSTINLYKPTEKALKKIRWCSGFRCVEFFVSVIFSRGS
jgi:hypothetical protein